MSDSRVIWYAHRKLQNPIAVIGFPSVGLISSITTSFIARELKMDIAAALTTPDLPPYALIQSGVPYPPVRVYVPAAKAIRKTKPKTVVNETADTTPAKNVKTAKPSRDLIIVTSEVAPKPEQTYDVTLALFETLKELGATEFVCLEGIPRFDGTASMLSVGSTPAMRKKAKALGLNPMDEGLVRGTTGVFLYEGAFEKTDVLGLLCPANAQVPDPRAAAALLGKDGALSKLVPGLATIDATPLVKEADEIETRLKSQQELENTSNQQIYG